MEFFFSSLPGPCDKWECYKFGGINCPWNPLKTGLDVSYVLSVCDDGKETPLTKEIYSIVCELVS